MELRYPLYDTAVFGAAANTEHMLFQVTAQADATHTENFTNSLGPGNLPREYSFLCDWIGAIVDHNAVIADPTLFFTQSFLEIRVAEDTKIKLPLQMCVANSAYGGHFTQTAAADRSMIGLAGQGFNLADRPIPIAGGVNFKVRVFQGLAVTASSEIKIVLNGILTRPG